MCIRDSPTLDVSDIGDNTLNLALSETALTESRNLAIEQNLTILRKRVAELGVAEAVIQRQGDVYKRQEEHLRKR